jgi:hypothetical protein
MDPLTAPLGQVFALRDDSLMYWASQQADAVPADLIAKVLQVMQTFEERAERPNVISRGGPKSCIVGIDFMLKFSQKI